MCDWNVVPYSFTGGLRQDASMANGTWSMGVSPDFDCNGEFRATRDVIEACCRCRYGESASRVWQQVGVDNY